MNEPIAAELVDKPQHTMLTHLGCVLLRIILGIYVMNADQSKHDALLIFLITAIVIFSAKQWRLMSKNVLLWKSYPRNILSYSLAAYLLKTKRADAAGLLMIVDALMGLQSRHTSSALSSIIKKE